MKKHAKPPADRRPKVSVRFRLALFLSLFVSWAWFAIAQPAAEGDAPSTPPTAVEATEGSTSPEDPSAPAEGGDSADGDNADADNAAAAGPETSEAAAGAKVHYGRIDGEINLSTSAFVKRLINEAESAGAEVLFLDLNTFGGRVDAAVAIRDALLDAPMKTVVYINKRAISAGALISYACDTIAISSGGTIGAAMPVTGNGEEIPASVQEKYLSYFREEMRATAEAKGRDPDIAEAMVDSDKVVEDVSEEGKLLTLGTNDAVRLGVADFEAKDIDA
ncbi:MAG: hypothetical protein AAFY88_32030, partial [Acidobacteriota bacterium]